MTIAHLARENRALRKEIEELRAQVGAYEEADRIFTADFDAATLVKDGGMLRDENANLKTKIEDLAWTKAEAVARLRGEVADLKAQVEMAGREIERHLAQLSAGREREEKYKAALDKVLTAFTREGLMSLQAGYRVQTYVRAALAAHRDKA